jgi:glycosyltransferase involved in cell wall biosynthesis
VPPNLLDQSCSDSILQLMQRDVNRTILPYFNFNSIEAGRKNILLPNLPPDLVDPKSIQNYDSIVFFTHWQQQMYNLFLDVPYANGIVMRNAIDPIPRHVKPEGKNILYIGNIDRGLDIVLASFKNLTRRKHPDSKLIVCALPDRGEHQSVPEANMLRAELRSNLNVEWYTSVDDDKMVELLKRSHIFVYPNDYPHVSYTPLIKAMSAACMCIHSSYGSLPETSLDITSMYGHIEDRHLHAMKFTNELAQALDIYNHKGMRRSIMQTLNENKEFVDKTYNWKDRSYQWNDLLLNFLT